MREREREREREIERVVVWETAFEQCGNNNNSEWNPNKCIHKYKSRWLTGGGIISDLCSVHHTTHVRDLKTLSIWLWEL